jgi:hypothetical protein
MRLAEFAISVLPVVEGRGGEDEDRGVDQQREHQRHGGIDGREFQRLALFRQRVAIGAGLHDAGMQIEIVRHHRRAEMPSAR